MQMKDSTENETVLVSSPSEKKRSKWLDELSEDELIDPPITKSKRKKKENPSKSSVSSASSSSSSSFSSFSSTSPSKHLQTSTSPTLPLSSTSPPTPESTSHSSFAPFDISSIPDFLQTSTWIQRCPSVDNYEKLNRIDEGAYGIVYRAREKKTGKIVALKKMKLDREKHGFPVTVLREISTLLACKHPHIVNVREIVMGSSLTSVFIVMDFLEHDLKTLLSLMPHPFTASEIKTLLRQLLDAVAHLHSHWIFHRDLKTSNLLMNNVGEMKVADFGLARWFSDPAPKPLTQLVVTLWYRAPELLLGETKYTFAIDMWSIGCIFAELLNREPLFHGQGELDQLNQIFKLLGQPPESLKRLPQAHHLQFQRFSEVSLLHTKFPTLTQCGRDLLAKLVCLDPNQRLTAKEALLHPYFKEQPLPKDPSMFPTFPSKASGEFKKHESPRAPIASHGEVEDYPNGIESAPAPFRLRFA